MPFLCCCARKPRDRKAVASNVGMTRGVYVDDLDEEVPAEPEILCSCCWMTLIEEDWGYREGYKARKGVKRVPKEPNQEMVKVGTLVDHRPLQTSPSQNLPRQTFQHESVEKEVYDDEYIEDGSGREEVYYYEENANLSEEHDGHRENDKYYEDYADRNEYLDEREETPESKLAHPKPTPGYTKAEPPRNKRIRTEQTPESKLTYPKATPGFSKAKPPREKTIRTREGFKVNKKLAIREDVGKDNFQVQVHFTPVSQRVKHPPLVVFVKKSWTFLTLIRKAIADLQRTTVEGENPSFDWVFEYDVNHSIPKLKADIKVIFGPQFLEFRDSLLKKHVGDFVEYHMTKETFVIKLWVYPKKYTRF